MWRLINKSKLVAWIGPWKGAAVVTLFFVTLASFLFWLDFFRAYETEVRILVINRQAETPRDITGNLAEIGGTLDFYERLLAREDTLTDPSGGLAPDERKAAWRSKVTVKKVGETDTLALQARDVSLEASRAWARGSTETLFAVAAFYYNIRTDADLRIIDGPFTKRVVERPTLYILASVASGLFLTILFFFLLRIFPIFFDALRRRAHKKHRGKERERNEEETPAYHIGESVPLIDPKKFLPSRPQRLHFEELHGETHENFRKPLGMGATAGAPANLPVAPAPETERRAAFSEPEPVPENLPFADSDFTFSEDARPASNPQESGETAAGPEVPQVSEPSMEEYKARLNKLLANGNE